MIYRATPFSITLNDPTPGFKVTPFFDAEYLRNGQRYGHSYYGRWIGNRTQAFEWYQFEIWMTLSDLLPRFQGHDIIQRQITKMVQYRAILTTANQ